MIPALILAAAISAADRDFLRECYQVEALIAADDALADLDHSAHQDRPVFFETECARLRERLGLPP